MRPNPNTPLQLIDWKFQLVKGTEVWRRDYSGTIAPLINYRFLLRCDRLTGRQGSIKRSSKYATHVFTGACWDGSREIVFPEKEAFQLTDEEAHLIQDYFAKWWIGAIAHYETPDVLRWTPDRLT